MQKIYMKADISNLMTMAARDLRVPGISIGFAVALSYIEKIAMRAIKINDTLILACLNQLGLLANVTKEEEEEYSKALDDASNKAKKEE